jgi:hypothetical protein
MSQPGFMVRCSALLLCSPSATVASEAGSGTRPLALAAARFLLAPVVHGLLTILRHPAREGLPEASMATGGAAGYVPNVHQSDVMRAILEGIIETGDVLGTAGLGCTILGVTVDNWLIDELATLGAHQEDREPEPNEDDALAPGL